MPLLTVVAGPNGSGKSTLISYLAEKGIELGHYINADDIARARGLTGIEGALTAQRLADEERENCLRQGIDFTFETVMSHESKPQFMARARNEGYVVQLMFVATSNPQLNASRVRARVILGGHDVPLDRILARYHRSISLLPKAILASGRSIVFDNSRLALKVSDKGLSPFVECYWENQLLVTSVRLPCPVWIVEALRMPSEGYGLTRVSVDTQQMKAYWKADPLLCRKRNSDLTVKELLNCAEAEAVQGLFSKDYS